jgi:hypothetical protein
MLEAALYQQGGFFARQCVAKKKNAPRGLSFPSMRSL